MRAKANWASQGERPSKYFLNLEKRKSKNNTLSQIYDDNNVLTMDPKKILSMTRNFYAQLYGGKPIDTSNIDEMDWNTLNIPQISREEFNGLEKAYSEQELLRALKKINTGKCPGTDGLPVEFYLHFWDSIKLPLLNSIQYELLHGELSVERRRGIINLIPKKDEDRRRVGNWRPITLLNIDYKILTKAMATRLQSVLPGIIHGDQTGFIPGRCISENLRTIQDVIDFTNATSQLAFMAALDFKKAFDSVEWNFIFKALEKFGFGPIFIDSVQAIFRNIQSCTTNAGFTSDYFSPRHGVRQGCCVAPYLFLIAVEVLGK